MTRKFGRSAFERSLIFKFELSAILKFYCSKFKPSSIFVYNEYRLQYLLSFLWIYDNNSLAFVVTRVLDSVNHKFPVHTPRDRTQPKGACTGEYTIICRCVIPDVDSTSNRFPHRIKSNPWKLSYPRKFQGYCKDFDLSYYISSSNCI